MKRRRKKKSISVIKLFLCMVIAFVCLAFLIQFRNQGKTQKSQTKTTDTTNATAAKSLKSSERTSGKYPQALLDLMDSNPETTDFVIGYPNADKKKAGGITSAEVDSSHPMFLQWDKRWGYLSYGESMIALSGCGPTCLSMAVVGLTHQPVTPADVCRYSEKNGFYVEGSGTSWQLISSGAAHYGLKAKELSLTKERMMSVLDAGNLIICAMGPGSFTTEGHFILVYDYEEDGFLIHDSNSKARSEKVWAYDEIESQIKNLWALSVG